jgi:hypothetical protein
MGVGTWWDNLWEKSDGVIEKVDDKIVAGREWKADRAFAYNNSETAKVIGNAGKWTKGAAGKVGLAALAVGALVAAPFVISDIRKKRRAPVEMAPEPALPPVMVDPQANTMMGMQPVTDGAWAARVRGGAEAGINPTNPPLMDDGSGQQPQALGR